MKRFSLNRELGEHPYGESVFRLTRRMVAFFALTMVLTTIAFSQPMGGGGRGRGMGKGANQGMWVGLGQRCSSDMMKLCADVSRGSGQMLPCLLNNKEKLSAECKTALEEHEQMRLTTGPCAAEIKKFCVDVQPGGMRVFACLMSHQAELSPTCKDHLDWRSRRAGGGPGATVAPQPVQGAPSQEASKKAQDTPASKPELQ